MFLTFPSTKDPTFSQRYPGKATVAIVTVCPYEWFQEWKDGRVQHRGEEYQGIKNALGNQLWNQVSLIMYALLNYDHVFFFAENFKFHGG